MKSIFKLFIYFFILIFLLLVLLPKESIYNYIEHKLASEKIIVSNEKRDEGLVSLKISDAVVYYEGIEAAKITNTSFLTLFFYNEINIKNIKVLDSLSTIIPSSVKDIDIKYSILDYKNIHIQSEGSFGKVKGTLNILNKKLLLNLEASSIMKKDYNKLLRSMKLKDGKYIWEKNL